jgi:hypothetical protein
MALRRDVELTGDFPETLPAVGAAPPQLTQAVLSLVHGASESFKGPGRVRLWAEPESARFVKLRLAHTGVVQGARHDLSLVRNVACAIGGSVSVEPGEASTTVTLLLPVAPAVGTPQPPAPLPRRADIRLGDPRASAFVTSLLASAGFRPAPREASVLAVWEGGEDPALVRRYLDGHASRRVLLLGTPRAPAPTRRVSVVPEATNLEAVRRTLGTVVEELLEITDDTI